MKIDFKGLMEGAANSLFIKEEVEKIAHERLSICATCEHDSKNKRKAGPEQCLYCGCILKIKTRSLSSECPLPSPKWLAVVDETTSNKIDQVVDNE